MPTRYARGSAPTGRPAGSPAPSRHGLLGVGHEIQHQPADRHVDLAVPDWQRRGSPDHETDPAVGDMSTAYCAYPLRRVEPDHHGGRADTQDGIGHSARAAADIQPAAFGGNVEPAHELGGNQPAPPPDIWLVCGAACPGVTRLCRFRLSDPVQRPGAEPARPLELARRSEPNGNWATLVK